LPVVLLAGAVGLAGCGAGSGKTGTPRAQVKERSVASLGTVSQYSPPERQPGPRVSGKLLDGKSFDLAAWRGKVVVVNFWGSWCAPCRAEARGLQAVYTATRLSGVEFLGVDVRDSVDNAVAFEQVFGVTYPSLFDRSGRVALKFRETPPNAVPATVVIDRSGRVAAVFRKPVLREDLEPVVRRVAEEKP
jgi:thiol-disulfide isomerase/thioredoxin